MNIRTFLERWRSGIGERFKEIHRSRSRSFFFLTVCFLAGVAAYSLFVNMPFLPLALGLFFSIPAVVFFWNKPLHRLLVLAILLFLGGMARFAFLAESEKDGLALFENGNISLEGIVIKSKHSQRYTNILIEAEKIIKKDGDIRARGSVLLRLPPARDYAVGRKLLVSCELYEQKNWPKTAPRWACAPEAVRDLGAGEINILAKFVAVSRTGFINGLRAAFPEPQLSLAGGLLLGDDFGFSADLFNSFVRTGTAHIVAVSGWNVTLIANYILAAAIILGLSKKRALPLLLIFIFFYILLTGQGSSVVRAGIMGAVSGLAWHLGRPYRAKNALFCAAGIMVFLSPRILLFDIGFALSFAATIGLVVFYSKLRSLVGARPRFHIMVWIKETFLQTVSATIFTLPIILFVFGNVSLIAPVANLLILPAVPIATILSFAAGIAGMFSPIAGQAFGYLAWVPLTYMVRMAELLSAIPWSNISFSNLWTRIAIITAIVVLIALRVFLKKKKSETNPAWNIIER